MFDSLIALKFGNSRKQSAYKAICELNILHDLKDYKPIVCGTIPIGIDLETSDLDIIMEVHELENFANRIYRLYDCYPYFKLKRTNIRGQKVIKANFIFNDFEFELFGQSQAVHSQYAYLHMIVEAALMGEDSSIRKKVLDLKKLGYKTEPAFCEVLGISGDPYVKLIDYGRKRGFI